MKTLAVRPDGSVMPDNANNNDSAVDPNSMQMPAIAKAPARRLRLKAMATTPNSKRAGDLDRQYECRRSAAGQWRE